MGDINLDVYAPDGSWSDSDYGYGGEGGGTVSGLLHAYICRYEGAGQYTLKATINWDDRYGDKMSSTSATGSFVMTLPPTPTPTPTPIPPPTPTPTPTPPLPPAPTYATPRAHLGSTINSNRIRLVMTTGSVPSGKIARITTWRVKVDNKLVLKERQGASERDTWSKWFKPHTGTHRIVVQKNDYNYKIFKVNTGR